jgi:hypothetical protein
MSSFKALQVMQFMSLLCAVSPTIAGLDSGKQKHELHRRYAAAMSAQASFTAPISAILHDGQSALGQCLQGWAAPAIVPAAAAPPSGGGGGGGGDSSTRTSGRICSRSCSRSCCPPCCGGGGGGGGRCILEAPSH